MSSGQPQDMDIIPRSYDDPELTQRRRADHTSSNSYDSYAKRYLRSIATPRTSDIDISNPLDIFDLIDHNVKRYTHKPLQTRDSIRVLELLAGTSGSTLSCRIFEIRRMDSDVQFEAISYVWGSPFPECYLYDVESRTAVTITENLSLALQALRYPDRSRVLWADAVCINQSDNNEKSHQVEKMGLVYAAASMVIVWLGNKELREAFEHVKSLEESPNDIVSIAHREPISLVDSAVTAILSIVGTEWFTRLWIIQEFVLARDVQFHAGGQHIDCKTFERAMALRKSHFFHLETDGSVDKNLSDRIIQDHGLAENLIGMRTKWHNQSCTSSSQASLYDWCCWVNQHPPKFTDKRDLIYACLGLASTQTRIVPNYNLSLTGVFLAFTWSVLKDGNMQILRDAVFLQQSNHRPSFLFYSSFRSSYQKTRVGSQNAGKARDAHAEEVKPASVRIRGVVVDRVSRCWDLHSVISRSMIYRRGVERSRSGRVPEHQWGKTQWWDTPGCVHNNPLDSWEERVEDMPSAFESIEDNYSPSQQVWAHEDCFEDPASLPRSAGADSPDEIGSTNLVEVYRVIQADAGKLLNEESTREDLNQEEVRSRFWRTITSHKDITPPTVPNDFGHVPFWENINEFHYPRFFTTSKGYMGKALIAAHGDVVVIFDGSDVPFVIRKMRRDDSAWLPLVEECYDEIGQWKLVGECHVDGWMDGSYYGHEVVDVVDQDFAMADGKPDIDFSHSKKTLLSKYFVLC
ncbi:heterokaryon incompatibility protein-domain-containing protein [Alternaria rosae]|uniref:heterokaryon incompatibility protein-domain-containing protein n=1 Tax=Alternaria rosae TaxID=1187941 RepID=UPI001E8E9655|nr:heterokaryon incompatibility protein-domain-containing protein [Alternaria rosae]KAH6868095.1 heterokaryon incompatibility protein-domain-containing protein [Alternaria rosae]